MDRVCTSVGYKHLFVLLFGLSSNGVLTQIKNITALFLSRLEKCCSQTGSSRIVIVVAQQWSREYERRNPNWYTGPVLRLKVAGTKRKYGTAELCCRIEKFINSPNNNRRVFFMPMCLYAVACTDMAQRQSALRVSRTPGPELDWEARNSNLHVHSGYDTNKA